MTVQKVAEDQLAHSVSTFNTTYHDTGLFGVNAVGEPMKMQALMYQIMYELVRLAHKTTEDEVARARTQLKTTLLSQLDGSTAVCEDIGRQVIDVPTTGTHARAIVRSFPATLLTFTRWRGWGRGFSVPLFVCTLVRCVRVTCARGVCGVCMCVCVCVGGGARLIAAHCVSLVSVLCIHGSC